MKRWIAVLMIMGLLCSLAGCKVPGNEDAFIDTFVASNEKEESSAEEKAAESTAITPPTDTDKEQPEETPTEEPEEEKLTSIKSPIVYAKWKASGLTEQYRKPFFELFIEHPLKEISGFPFAEMIQYVQKTAADKSIIALRCIFYTYEDYAGLTAEAVMRHHAYAERKKNLLCGYPSGYSDYTIVDLAYESNGDLVPENILFCETYSSAVLLSGADVLPEWDDFADQWQPFEGEKVSFELTSRLLWCDAGVIDFKSVVQDEQITVLQLKNMEDVQKIKEGYDIGNCLENKEYSDEYFNEKTLYLVYQNSARSTRVFSDLRKNGDVLEIWTTDPQEYVEVWFSDDPKYWAYLIEVPTTELIGIDQVKIKTSQKIYT